MASSYGSISADQMSAVTDTSVSVSPTRGVGSHASPTVKVILAPAIGRSLFNISGGKGVTCASGFPLTDPAGILKFLLSAGNNAVKTCCINILNLAPAAASPLE